MSLNQAFLKLYGGKPDAPPVTDDRPADGEPLSRPARQDEAAGEVNISLRVDRGETPVSRRFAAMREDRQRNIFSIEEERRRRNPCRKTDDEAEWEVPGPAFAAPEESARTSAEACGADPADRVSDEPEVIPMRGAVQDAPEQAEPVCGSAWCEETLERAEVVAMPDWPRTCGEIFQRGEQEFALLADVVNEAVRKGNKIFGFGGWGGGTGVSTLMLGILDEMLRRRKRVLVIDADFQHPDLAEILDIPAGATWEKLARETGPGEPNGLVRVETGTVPFWFLPLSRESVPEAVAASCRKSWFRAFLELAEPFDLVLIDHGSLRSGSPREKVLELLRFGCDGYFMVTDARNPPRGEEANLPAVSDECRLPCFGVIENFT